MREHPVMGSSKRWLELVLIEPRLNKGKRAWGFREGERSYGKVIKKSMVKQGCMLIFVY